VYTGYFFDGKFRKELLNKHMIVLIENRVYSITSYIVSELFQPIDVFDRKRECNEDVEKYYSDFKFKTSHTK
jgi:hypothetical protein